MYLAKVCKDDGLNKSGTALALIPSHVSAIPTGAETGIYLAVDLGGTNSRVCSVELHGDSTYTLTQSKTSIPRNMMVASSCRPLFDFLGEQIREFMQEHLPDDMESCQLERARCGVISEEWRKRYYRRLGFTFSFTFEQHSLNQGSLSKWTKGFDIPDAVGKCPSALLQQALDRLGLPVLVTALVNDTVGTLMARSYSSPGKSTAILGAIFGTGTNGAYVEKMHNIRKMHCLPGYQDHDLDDQMIMNIEWGGFDDELSILPSTAYDEALDRDSVNPADQMFEKRISGMYLGEILRRVILTLVETGKLEMQVLPQSSLREPWSIDTSLLSQIAQDSSECLLMARRGLATTLGAQNVTLSDAKALQLISTAIVRRAARLSAVAIAAVIFKSGRLRHGKLRSIVPRSMENGVFPRLVESGYNLRSWVSLLLNFGSDLFHHLATSLSTATRWFCTRFGTQTSRCVDKTLLMTSPEYVATDEDDIIDIGVDGSLIEFYPEFETMLRSALREIEAVGDAGERRIRIGLAKDGSGVGAVLIAQAAERQEKSIHVA